METLTKKIKGYERFILILGALVIAFVGCYKFIFKSQMEKRKILLNEIEAVSHQYDLQEEHKKSVEEMANVVKSYKTNLERIRAQYPPVMYYEEVMFLFKDFISKTPVTVSGVNLSLYNQIYAPSILSEELVKKITDVDVLKEANELGFVSNNQEYKFQNSSLSDGAAYATNFSLTINGTMDEVREFVKTIKEYHPKAVMTTFSLTGHEDGTVTAPINFSFVGIMDKHVENYSMLGKDYWNRTKISGKDNLFVRTEEDGTQTTDMNELKYQQSNADFTMRLLNYGEGITPPTVMLSIKNPAQNDLEVTQIYGDNKENEEVLIYVEEHDGKYFAKIKTETEMLPGGKINPLEEQQEGQIGEQQEGQIGEQQEGQIEEQQEGQIGEQQEDQEEELEEKIGDTIEFIPKGDDLLLYVVSRVRVNDDDKAGVNITIDNKTDKKFVVNVVDEDINYPRVQVTNNDVKVYRTYN